jgi:hypothetical protein
MRFVIQIFDDADLAFRVFGAKLRTVLSTTTVLADKPLRLSGRAIAQRFSALAQSGHSATAVESPLLGAKRTLANRYSPASIYEYTP